MKKMMFGRGYPAATMIRPQTNQRVPSGDFTPPAFLTSEGRSNPGVREIAVEWSGNRGRHVVR
jgi:hypothetical protein